MKNFQVTIDGLESLVDIENLPPRLKALASRAINKTLDRARTAASRELTTQLAFPASYLRGTNNRLYVGRFASEQKLEGSLAARRRPTSLARFVKGDKTPLKKGGVNVMVHRGKARFMKRAFIIKLRKGVELNEESFNLGLAMRMPAGQKPSRAYKPVPLGRGLWLLYGPSVQQAFIGENPQKGVAEKIKPEMGKFLETEFQRLVQLGGRV